MKESFQLYSTHSFDVKNNTMCENCQNMSHLKVCSMRLFTVGNLKHCEREREEGILDELFPPDILTAFANFIKEETCAGRPARLNFSLHEF